MPRIAPTFHVWGIGTARTMRVYWALHEFGLDYISHPVRARTADMDDPAFLRVSPGRKIPAFQDRALSLTESGAITDYLFEQFGAQATDPDDAAHIEQWSCFVLMELDATALYVLRRHEDLPTIYGEAPAAVASARAYFGRQALVIAELLDDEREFIAGGRLSKADIFLSTCCDWALHCRLELPESLTAYHARHSRRPAYLAARSANFPSR